MDVGDVAIAILAAGKASRFGADKLMAQMDGVRVDVSTFLLRQNTILMIRIA